MVITFADIPVEGVIKMTIKVIWTIIFGGLFGSIVFSDFEVDDLDSWLNLVLYGLYFMACVWLVWFV